MSPSRPPKDDAPLPRPALSLSKKERQPRAQDPKERARETIARAHQAADRARQLGRQSEEAAQHRQARREYEAEHAERFPLFPPPLSSPAPLPPPLPHPVVRILLIEDSPADIALFQQALQELPIPCQLTACTHFRELEAFVTQAGKASAARPQLILLDYFLTDMEVAETLALCRSLPGYDTIPVILFSGLPETEGQQRSTVLGTTAFVQKPGALQPYFDAVAAIVYRWGCRPPEEAAAARGERKEANPAD